MQNQKAVVSASNTLFSFSVASHSLSSAAARDFVLTTGSFNSNKLAGIAHTVVSVVGIQPHAEHSFLLFSCDSQNRFFLASHTVQQVPCARNRCWVPDP